MRRRRFLGQTGSWGDNLLCPTDAIVVIFTFLYKCRDGPMCFCPLIGGLRGSGRLPYPSAAPRVPMKPLYRQENNGSLSRTDTLVRPYGYAERFFVHSERFHVSFFAALRMTRGGCLLSENACARFFGQSPQNDCKEWLPQSNINRVRAEPALHFTLNS